MDLYFKLIVNIINACAAVILTFSIFKIPIKDNDKQIAIIGVFLGATNFYLKFIIDSSVYQILQILVYILIVTIIRRYPLLYSAAVCVIGSIAYSIIDGIATFISIKFGLTTMDSVIKVDSDYIVMHLIVTLLYLVVAFVLVRYRIGFSFVVHRFSGVYSLGTSTFIWSGLLAIAVLVIQISSQNYEFLTINSYSLILATLVLMTSIIYAYYQNKKSLKDRYGDKNK